MDIGSYYGIRCPVGSTLVVLSHSPVVGDRSWGFGCEGRLKRYSSRWFGILGVGLDEIH